MVNRPQQLNNAPDQVSQGTAGDPDTVVFRSLVLPVQRHVIQKLGQQHPGQEADISNTLVQHIGRCRGCNELLAIDLYEDLINVEGIAVARVLSF
jgi:hypothetical protein